MTRWTATQIPDQCGRVAVVTGANAGIGFETAAALTARGARVVLAVRDVDKGKDAASRIAARVARADVGVVRLDLSSLASIRSAAQELKETLPGIDLLINNAGVMLTPNTLTADGFELQFGTNHLGHFALTGLLLEHMLLIRGSRVVTVSSNGHRIRSELDFDDLHTQRNYDPMVAYGRSKLANLLFTYELHRRLTAAGASTIAVACHPGGSRTDLSRNAAGWIRIFFAVVEPLLFQSAAMGALPTLRSACDPTVLGGEYYGPRGVGQQRGYPSLVPSSARSCDHSLAKRLWTASEELTGVRYPLFGNG